MVERVKLIEIRPDLIREAEKKAKNMGTIRNSIRDGQGNLIGFLGELLVAEAINGKVQNTFDYDIVKDNYKIEVKTKACTSYPEINYECSITDFNIEQKCDFYVFVRILEDLSKGWILGGIHRNEYFKKATFCTKGSIDPNSNLGWKFKADCYNLKISKLKKLKIMKN